MRYVAMVAMVVVGAGCDGRPVEPEEIAKRIRGGLPAGWTVHVWREQIPGHKATMNKIEACYRTDGKTYAFNTIHSSSRPAVMITHKGVKAKQEDFNDIFLAGFYFDDEENINPYPTNRENWAVGSLEETQLKNLASQLHKAIKCSF